MSFCEMHCNCFIVSSKLSIWYAENRIFIHSGVSECHSYSLVWIIAIPSPLNNVMQIYFFIQNISLKVDILYWGYIYAMLLYAKSFNSKHTVKSCSLILALHRTRFIVVSFMFDHSSCRLLITLQLLLLSFLQLTKKNFWRIYLGL